MIEIVVIVESRMDAVTATKLAERVLVEKIDWLVVKRLTCGDIIREQKCWEETDLELLRYRGANTGLREYLKEVEQRLISILVREA